jgi:protein SCO1/2
VLPRCRSHRALAGLAGLALLAGCAPAAGRTDLRGDEPTGQPRRPSFVLTADDGSTYDFAERTAGRPTVVFFGYTACPDICPTTMADLATGLRSLDPEVAEQVEVVFVTTDPVRDTPEVLDTYLARFDESFVGLTGTPEQVAAAQEAAGVAGAYPVKDRGGDALTVPEELLPEGYLVEHGSTLIAYGSQDTEVVSWRPGTLPEDYAADLSAIVEEDR